MNENDYIMERGDFVLKKIIPVAMFCTLYTAAFISLILPIGAIDENQPFRNHLFLLIWAVVAMAFAVFRSRQEARRSRKIVGDAIVAGVVVYSGLALLLIVLGGYYRETLELPGGLLRVSQWKVLVFMVESALLTLGSVVVIWRTNCWSWDESRPERNSEG